MKHTGRKWTSWLLSLALVLGLLPGMSLTVHAEEQVITCTGTKGEANLLNMFEGSGITYTVGNGMNEAQFYKNGIFTAPEGKCFTKIRVAYGYSDWGGFAGRALTVTHGNAIIIGDDNTLKIEFTVDDLAIYNVTLNTNGGTVNDGNITTYTEFYGAALPTNVTRNGYIFEGWYDNAGLNGEPMTSIASDATGNKEFWAKWTKLPSLQDVDCVVDPISDQMYTGRAIYPELTVKYGSLFLADNTDYTVTYANNKDAGTATVTLKGVGEYTGTKSVSFKILKANSSIVTAPTANTLTYNGKPQELVTAGKAEGGEMQYTISKDATTAPVDGYKASLPTATDAGTYYVWYKVVGDSSHNDTDPVCVTVTISAPYVPSYSGGDDSSPATTTVTVPVSGDDNTVNVSVSVSGDSATVQDADLDTVLSETADTGTVTIDVSALNTEITEAVIPAAMVEKIAGAVADTNNDADGLEVKLSTGSVTFDAEALEAIADQMTGNDLKLNLDSMQVSELTSAQQAAVADIEVEAVLDAYLTSNGQRISDFGGGTATVKVAYALKPGQVGEGLTVWYVADDGTRTAIEMTYDGENVVFPVPHFSNYVIAYDADKAAEANLLASFRDLSASAWYADGVKYAIKNKIMDGMGDGVFAPNGSTTRAQLAQILYNMEGKPAASAALNFTDVVTTNWYADALRWAVANGVMDGYGDGTFGPNDALTREQLVTILYRYAKLKGVDVSVGEDTNILSYDDAFSVSDWAMAAMQWAVGSGAVGGKTATTLNPKDSATRAEIATIMMRYQTEIAK